MVCGASPLIWGAVTASTHRSVAHTRRNVIANFAGRGVSAASIYVFIPLYLRFLGIEAYGVVGFFAVLQGVFAFADIGLTATLSREMARLSAREDTGQEMRDLLRTVEVVYWMAALGAALLVVAGAGVIADQWLNARTLDRERLVTAVRLMGVVLALQLPAGLYLGGILGRERQVLANAIQAAWSLVRGSGAALVLWLVSPTLEAFFAWQIAVTACYVAAVRFALARVLPPASAAPRFDISLLHQVWRYAAGMTAMALLSAALTQTDRLVISKMLSLEQFGYYVLAASLAQVPVILVGPVASAIFPRLTALAAIGDRHAVSELYHRACQVAAVVVLPIGLTVTLFSHELTEAWTGSPTTAQHIAGVTTILCSGSTLLALLIIPYNLALAYGWTSLNVTLSLASVVVIVPLLIVLVNAFGLLGGGIAWLCLNAAVTPPFIYLLHRRLLPAEVRRWYLRDVGRPLLGSVGCVVVGRWLIPAHAHGVLALAGVGAVGIAAFTCAALATPGLIGFARRGRWVGEAGAS